MVSLLIPPVSDCFMPTLGAAQIIGYLKSVEIPCKLYDINAELNLSVLSDDCLIPQCIKKIINSEKNNYYKLVTAYSWISHKSPYTISTDDFRCDFDWRDIEGVKRFIDDESSLIYRLLSGISSVRELSMEGGLVGMSISYDSQLIPSILLAKIIKSHNPKIKILFGGSFFYNYSNDFYNLFYCLDIIDYVITGPGEQVIQVLYNGEIALGEVDGIQVNNVRGRYYINSCAIKNSPIVYAPSFDDIDFSAYPTKEKAFPYMIRSTCYYGKCKFCNGDRVLSNQIQKDIVKAFENILLISERLHIANVYIVDAALSPADFSHIAGMKMQNNISWIANARFDKPLADDALMKGIAENGCKMLRFGLESGSQNVLKLMNKGTDVKVAENILKTSYKHGIQNHLYIMLGYPGETEEDRDITIEFLTRNREYIASYSISFFQPIPNTPIYLELEQCIHKKTDNVYSDMIEYIYGDDSEYNKLVHNAERIKAVLDGYAQTNSEFYSANIFSQTRTNNVDIVIRSDMIFPREEFEALNLRLGNALEIACREQRSSVSYIIADLYYDLEIRLRMPAHIIEVLKNATKFDLAHGEEKAMLNELLALLGSISRFVEHRECLAEVKYFSMHKLYGKRLNNISIQFSPGTKLDNGGTVWTE